jgi:hypothetical protein
MHDATTSMRDVVPITSLFGSYTVHALFGVGGYGARSGSFRMRETTVALKWESLHKKENKKNRCRKDAPSL